LIKDQMDKIYSENTSDAIPWNREVPPEILDSMVESGKILPCRAIDLGCGTGNYSVYLASRGFRVVGIDISTSAIDIARYIAKKKKLSCCFLCLDLTKPVQEITETFDFAFEWELLHHIFPPKREAYIQNINRLLNTGGIYLSVHFSEEDEQFGGKGKYRKTSLGTELYFSSAHSYKRVHARFSSKLWNITKKHRI
jgi:SAM-dependent methyltransferase